MCKLRNLITLYKLFFFSSIVLITLTRCNVCLFKAVLKSPMPSRLIAPAPASNQGHIPIPPKVPGHITVTIESSIAPTPSIPVATISGQQVSELSVGCEGSYCVFLSD